MPACPFGNHRLVLGVTAACERCANDLTAYASLQDMPVMFYNRARHLWDAGDLAGAVSWLQAALYLRRSFPEAYWLWAAIELRKGNLDRGRHYLTIAKQLRAPVDVKWLDSPASVDGPSTCPEPPAPPSV